MTVFQPQQQELDLQAISQIRYIKLGAGVSRTDEKCINNGLLYMGFGSNDAEFNGLAKAKDWEGYRNLYLQRTQNSTSISDRARRGNASRATNLVKAFFESQPNTLWISFYSGYLYYGVVDTAAMPIVDHELKGCTRSILGGWKNTDVNAKRLEVEKLAGHLIRIQRFQGTSFVLDKENNDYLKLRLSGNVPHYIVDLDNATRDMHSAIAKAIKKLQPKDFEILVEIIFSQSWRRIGTSGGCEKFVDITFEDPLSNADTIAVQVKSKTNSKEIDSYLKQSDHIDRYKRFYFAYHTGSINEGDYRGQENVTFLDCNKLSKLVIDSGLIHWLREKTS